MAQKETGYQVVPFSKLRQIVIDFQRVAHRKHTFYGLLEVDVTKPRQYIRDHKARTGESLSFTAFIITCLGRAIDEDKSMHAYLNWRNQLVLFDEVDVTTIIEIELEEQSFPYAHIIRAVNRRSFRDIHDEIRAIQSRPDIIEASQKWGFLRVLFLLPPGVRDLFYWAFSKNPHLVKEYIGTVSVTAVGMFGKSSGWGIGLTNYTLTIALGGIAKKPAVVEGRIEPREFLSMTIELDHDIIDGAPAARFVTRLTELIQNGYGLIE